MLSWFRKSDISRFFLHANSDNLTFFVAIIILGVLLNLDVLTTSLVISLGGYEMNPLMAGVVGVPMIHLFVKWLVLIFVVLVATFSDRIMNGTGICVMCVIIGWYSLVVANNTLTLEQLLSGIG
ncbi:MAG TPA: DUF5658 family protein [Methanoregulaceae archaeon]|jgi:hypothetical protein|nr:DUF5658 family protein [Methanoregulaceae archaeon]